MSLHDHSRRDIGAAELTSDAPLDLGKGPGADIGMIAELVGQKFEVGAAAYGGYECRFANSQVQKSDGGSYALHVQGSTVAGAVAAYLRNIQGETLVISNNGKTHTVKIPGTIQCEAAALTAEDLVQFVARTGTGIREFAAEIGSEVETRAASGGYVSVVRGLSLPAGGLLTSPFGRGSTEEASLEDLARKLRGKEVRVGAESRMAPADMYAD